MAKEQALIYDKARHNLCNNEKNKFLFLAIEAETDTT